MSWHVISIHGTRRPAPDVESYAICLCFSLSYNYGSRVIMEEVALV